MSPLNFSFKSFLFVRDVTGDYRAASVDEILQAAQQLLGRDIRGSEPLVSPKLVRDFLRIKLGTLEHEVFALLMLDSQHRVIDYLELFRGTIDSTAVYPREVVKETLARNAAALILVHNHPSGVTTPSSADGVITQKLRAALELVDVRILDHLIVAGSDTLSFAEQGLL